VKNVAGSGGKWLDVSAERFPRWIASFSVRHGVSGAAEASLADGAAGRDNDDMGPEQALDVPGVALAVTFGDDHVSFTALDGSIAECHPPFPPARGVATITGLATLMEGAGLADSVTPGEVAEALAAHARRPRTVGVLLVRLGGYAAGVFTGYPPALQEAKVGSRLVHGRSAAGGWSQHRFARRREKQANEALDAAADAAVMIFGKQIATVRSKSQITARSGEASAGRRPQPTATGLDAVVLGGDRRAVAELRDDPRLAPYFKLAAERFLTVPDPKRAVLVETPRLFTSVRIRLTET